MLTLDRHIAIQSGWIAGPAFGVAMMAAPEYFHLGPNWSGVLFWGGIAVFVLTIIVVFVLSLHEEKKRKMVAGPIIVMALGALVFCGGTSWYFWPKNAAASPPDITAEFEGMYAKDFSDLLNTENRLPFQIKNEQTGLDVKQEIRFRLYYDFKANSDFVSIYISPLHDARINIYDFIHMLRDQIPLAREGIRNSIGVGASAPGVPYTSGKDLTFSGRVFIYTLNSLDPVQLGALVSYYRDAGMFLEVRSNDYYWFHRSS